jgi:hypothetical protein
MLERIRCPTAAVDASPNGGAASAPNEQRHPGSHVFLAYRCAHARYLLTNAKSKDCYDSNRSCHNVSRAVTKLLPKNMHICFAGGEI